MISAVIQRPCRPGSEQASKTSANAVSTRISNCGIAFRKDRLILTWPGCRTPRGSGDHQPMGGLPSSPTPIGNNAAPVSYTHLRAHETVLDLVCRLLLE